MILETEEVRVAAGHGLQFRVLRLRNVDHPAVITEVGRQKRRLPIEAEPPHYQPIEMAHQEVGQVKAARFLIGQLGEALAAGVELVAVGPGNALNPGPRQRPVQQPARAAIGIADENTLEPGAFGLDFRQHGSGDFFRPVVQFRRQALELDVAPAVQVPNAYQLAGDGAAGNDQCFGGGRGQDAFLISSLAVSTAVAASRQ